MPFSKKVLEDSIRLGRIRAIKRTLYVVEAALLVALAVFFVFVIGGAALTPRLYLPIDQFIAVVALLLLVICVESFFFRILEIRFARSSSAKHLMAKNSITHSLVLAIVAAIVTIVLMVPSVLAVTEDATQRTVSLSGEDFTFWTMDPFALQSVSELQASCPDDVELYIVRDSDYVEYDGVVSEMYFKRINRNDYEIVDSLTIEMPDMGYTMLHLVVNDLSAPGATVTVVIVNDTSENITGIVAILSMAFVVANVAWIAYLTPIERKYAQGSIYK
ncbi:MAG: hypothetical protein AB7S97_03280 [Thermoplasmata archaeon]